MSQRSRRNILKAGALAGVSWFACSPEHAKAQIGGDIVASTYLGRYIAFNQPTDHDQSRMPQRKISASPRATPFAQAKIQRDFSDLQVASRAGAPRQPLARTLAESGTTAIVVLHDGQLVWEHYPLGDIRGAPQRCFSVTKSVASALIGLAVADGAIDSVEAPIGRWLPDVQDARVRELTIAHLLEMRSGIRFTEGILPWNDEPRTYYATDMRERLLTTSIADPVGAFFHYNDWHPLLLSLILERATRKSVTEYLQERVWNALGAEYPASMMVDRSDALGLEHLESGLSATARDLAKFGQLYLQDGMWQGRRLLPAGWVESTTSPAGARSDPAWFDYYRERPWGRFLSTGRYYYRRMWWGNRPENGGYDFFAMGVLGQHIYVSPDTATVIVRLSSRFPPGMWWAPIFRAVALAAAGRTT
jgi:CubicO group peptidase (beta-lactamase class C family)